MSKPDRNVAVVGAGVAGLNAAVSLAKSGAQVTMLERRPYVGGRAYSYLHPALNEVVDLQHVLVGCCTNLIDFCSSAGLSDKIRWYDRQTYLEPADANHGTRSSSIETSSLPAPLHYAGSFLTASMLGMADKIAIARGLMGFARGNSARDDESVAQWYRRTRQTERAVRHLWEPLIVATLNDRAENCSMKYAGKVIYELFLKNDTGGRLGIPTVPLSEFYAAGAELLRTHGGRVELRSSIEQLTQQADGRWSLRCGEQNWTADDVILALPFEQTQKLISEMSLRDAGGEDARGELLTAMEHFTHSPFISILLWFDRQITELDHAWLLDSTIQWFFHKSRIRGYPAEQGSYVELVIAGSKTELSMTREQILAPALAELQRFFPETGRARLIKSGILKEARATFSVTPGLDPFRPQQRTAIPGLYLAGDWTATGWPSTMEGAARSGRLAAGEVAGERDRFLVADADATGLMRWLSA
ncbi:MAG TPA: hydroxysqualene dehydroxylase HpnE [Acidobacteriaceae bacterium]